MHMIRHRCVTLFRFTGRCAFFYCLLASAPLPAEPAVETNAATSAAKIHFSQTTHDLGLIPAGTLVKREIVFTNQGTADLTIREISHTCSCTTTPEWTRVTPPKGSGRILVEFHAMALSGAIQKTIAVHTNDPAQLVTTLTLQGVVKQVLEATPSVAVMTASGRQPQDLSTVIRIINHTDQPITLQDPVSNHKQFRPRLETITAGKEFRLTVSVLTPMPADLNHASITLATSSVEIPVITIPAVVLTTPELIVHPPQLFLQALTPDPYLISIRNQSPDPITVTNATCDAPGCIVTIREITAGKEFELSVRFPKDLVAPPGKTYTVAADTSAPGHRKITIPVSFARAPSFPPPSP
jgi:hypothetical protein